MNNNNPKQIKADTIDWSKDNHMIVAWYQKTSVNPTSVKVTDINGNVTVLKPYSPDFINDAPLTC